MKKERLIEIVEELKAAGEFGMAGTMLVYIHLKEIGMERPLVEAMEEFCTKAIDLRKKQLIETNSEN